MNITVADRKIETGFFYIVAKRRKEGGGMVVEIVVFFAVIFDMFKFKFFKSICNLFWSAIY